MASTDAPILVPLGEDFPEIRESVRAICAGFPGDYWRGLEDNDAYPEAFVKALTERATSPPSFPRSTAAPGCHFATAP